MATVFFCDVCVEELDTHVATVSLTPGSMQIAVDAGSRFAATGNPIDYLLCERCGQFLNLFLEECRELRGVFSTTGHQP